MPRRLLKKLCPAPSALQQRWFLRLFGDRMFRSANTAMFMMMGVFMGVLFLLPLFLQQLRGLSALQSGLTTFPQALGMIAMVRFGAGQYPGGRRAICDPRRPGDRRADRHARRPSFERRGGHRRAHLRCGR